MLSFESAVNACPLLVGHCQRGLGALSQLHRQKIKVNTKTNITGSINVDKILEAKYPNASRWDYGIGFRERLSSANSNDQVCWVEIHPAESGKNIKEVLAKKEFHCSWLKKHAPELDSLQGEFVWIATGHVGIPKHHRRELAMKNIKLQGQVHQL